MAKTKPKEVITIQKIEFKCLKHMWEHLLCAGPRWPLEIHKCLWRFHVNVFHQILIPTLDKLLLLKEDSQRPLLAL